MRVVRSAWVLPVDAPPIAGGAVALEDGAIVAVGPADEVLARCGESARRAHGPDGVSDLGPSILIPALVNAHTHLELSWMANRPTPRGSFAPWVRAMLARRAPPPDEVAREAARAVAALVASGTAAVGDVGNTTAAWDPLRGSSLAGRVFLEVIGWGARGAAGFDDAVALLDAAAETAPPALPRSVVPLGPHAVDPETMERLARRARDRGDVVSIHLAESREEDALLRTGGGALRALMDTIGALPAGWEPPRLSPAQVLDRAGLLGPRTLAVHGVHLGREDARLIAARGATVVLCPRSNAWLGVGDAPVAMLLEEGVRLALGTDSLASNEDLDLLAELRVLRAVASEVPAAALLRAATLGGAEALGLGESLGSITPGKRGMLIALPPAASCAPSTRAVEGDGDGDPYRTVFAGPPATGARVIRA